MKILRNGLRREHGNGMRAQMRIDRIAKHIAAGLARQIEMGDLAFGMDARISAPRSVNGYVAMIEHRQHSSKLTLNRPAIRLNLPAVVVRPVILNCHPEVLHVGNET